MGIKTTTKIHQHHELCLNMRNNRTEHPATSIRAGRGRRWQERSKDDAPTLGAAAPSTTTEPTQWHHPLVIHVSGSTQAQGRTSRRTGRGQGPDSYLHLLRSPWLGTLGKTCGGSTKKAQIARKSRWGSRGALCEKEVAAGMQALCVFAWLCVARPSFLAVRTERALAPPSPLHSHFCTYRVL